ncbi:hypothetical protein SB861_55615, partial [Paraburkholderia sp. SIMBA_049]
LHIAGAFDPSLIWQGFRGAAAECAESHRRPLRRGFQPFEAKFSTKLSTAREPGAIVLRNPKLSGEVEALP